MIIPIFLTAFIVCLAVVIHYATMKFILKRLPLDSAKERYSIILGILIALSAHAVEIMLFAVGYYFLSISNTYGFLEGDMVHGFRDCIYFSFVTYTTLGFGDLIPVGNLRILTAVEALVGLVLITWTASLLFIQMQKLWGHK